MKKTFFKSAVAIVVLAASMAIGSVYTFAATLEESIISWIPDNDGTTAPTGLGLEYTGSLGTHPVNGTSAYFKEDIFGSDYYSGGYTVGKNGVKLNSDITMTVTPAKTGTMYIYAVCNATYSTANPDSSNGTLAVSCEGTTNTFTITNYYNNYGGTPHMLKVEKGKEYTFSCDEKELLIYGIKLIPDEVFDVAAVNFGEIPGEINGMPLGGYLYIDSKDFYSDVYFIAEISAENTELMTWFDSLNMVTKANGGESILDAPVTTVYKSVKCGDKVITSDGGYLYAIRIPEVDRIDTLTNKISTNIVPYVTMAPVDPEM